MEFTIGVGEDGVAFVLTDKISPAALADAYALVERHNVIVSHVRVHPMTWSDEVSDLSFEGSLWGAKLQFDFDQPRDRVDLLIDDGAVKARMVIEP